MRLARPSLFLAVFVARALSQDASSSARVEGTVVSSTTGELLRKASLDLQPVPAGAPYNAVSDSNGRFAFPDLPAGIYSLSVSRPGYVAQTVYHVVKSSMVFTLEPGQQMTGLVVKLTPGGVIAGQVLDQDGDPRERPARVVLRRETRRPSGSPAPHEETITDAEGSFVFVGLQPGNYILSAVPDVRSSGRRPRAQYEESEMVTYYPDALTPASSIPIQVTAGAEIRTADIRIQKGHTVHVRGRIIDPVPGLIVYLATSEEAPSLAAYPGGPSAAFDIADVPPGAYRLIATTQSRGASRLYFGQVPLTVDQMDADDVDVEVHPAIDVTGRFVVVDPAAQGVAAPVTWARPPSVRLDGNQVAGPGAQAQETVSIAQDGTFRIANVLPVEQHVVVTPPPGMYVKSVHAGGADITADQTFDAAADDGLALEIVLSPNAGEVLVQAYDSNAMAVTGVSSLLWSKDGARDVNGALGADGLLHFTNLAPGDYWLAAWEQSDTQLTNADVKTLFENRATPVTVEEGVVSAVGVRLISSEEIEQALPKTN